MNFAISKGLLISSLMVVAATMSPHAHAQKAPLPVPAAVLSEVQVPGTTPMGAAPIDLAAFKYTEREFYASGKANRYRGTLPEALATAAIGSFVEKKNALPILIQ